MLRLLIIDDTYCKKDLASLLAKHKFSVKLDTDSEVLLSDFRKVAHDIENYSSNGKRLTVNTTESILLLNVSEIIRCESQRNYTNIYLTDKRKQIVSKTLMDFEDLLSEHGFLRIHKSHLINVNYMDKYVKSEGGYVLLNDGTKLPVSVRKKDYLFKELEKL
jgi:two-component system LytT family response regulator